MDSPLIRLWGVGEPKVIRHRQLILMAGEALEVQVDILPGEPDLQLSDWISTHMNDIWTLRPRLLEFPYTTP